MITQQQKFIIDKEIDRVRKNLILNAACKPSIVFKKGTSIFGLDPEDESNIEDFIKKNKGKNKQRSVYEAVMIYLERLNQTLKTPFIRKNGIIDEAQFYTYAYIDKSTWSSMKNNSVKKPKKKTLLKLSIALRLSEDEATDLLLLGGESFDSDDIQDLVILALLNLKIYNIATVIDTLDSYRFHGEQYFDSIYDTPEEQVLNRQKYEEKKEQQKQEKLKQANL